MSSVYGYPVTGIDDPFVRAVQTGVENFSRAALPASKLIASLPVSQVMLTLLRNADFLVNLIPWLKYVPDWFPGAGWKRIIKKWRDEKDEMVQKPYDWAKSNIVRARPLNCPITHSASSVEIGDWFCPFLNDKDSFGRDCK
jgi:hypothetical protein